MKINLSKIKDRILKVAKEKKVFVREDSQGCQQISQKKRCRPGECKMIQVLKEGKLPTEREYFTWQICPSEMQER